MKNEWSKRQINGLIKSFKKWDDIVERGGIDGKSDDCKLCELYSDHDCKKCPIAIHAELSGCYNTPWRTWINHHINSHHTGSEPHIHNGCKECEHFAKEERSFIKKLIPEEYHSKL